MEGAIEMILFLYNVILLVLFSIPIVLSFFIYLKVRRPVYLAIGVLFLFYVFDNLVIYLTEFIDWFARTYDKLFMTIPTFKTGIYVITFLCMIVIIREVLHRKAPGIVYVVLGLIALVQMYIPVLDHNSYQVWIYYAPAQLYYIFLSICAMNMYRKIPEAERTPYQEMFKKLILCTAVLAVVILIEDTFVIFNVDVYNPLQLHIFNRSLSEDLLRIIYLIQCVKYLMDRFQIKPEDAFGQVQTAEQVGTRSADVGLADTASEDMASANMTSVNPASANTASADPTSANMASVNPASVNTTSADPTSVNTASVNMALADTTLTLNRADTAREKALESGPENGTLSYAAGKEGFAAEQEENAQCNIEDEMRSPNLSEETKAKVSNMESKFYHFSRAYQLTVREQDILALVLAGENNTDISEHLMISLGTVKTHIHNIYMKLDITRRRELMEVYQAFDEE